MLHKSDLILPLSSISSEDKDYVGEKAAYLGEMVKQGFPYPPGFVITQNAYHQFLAKRNLPDKLIKEIFRAYKRLERPLIDADVEVILSSPLSQKKEVIVAHGEAILVEKIKSIWTSSSLPIIVRKIPRASCSGVMFTINPKHNGKTKIIISEEKTENHYEVSKDNLEIVFKGIKRYTRQKLTDHQIINVAALGKKLQAYHYFPQEVHFAIENNKIYITSIKPITHTSLKLIPIKSGQSSKLLSGIINRKILLKGNSLYPGMATGHLRIIQNIEDINRILRGEIIVIPYQDLIKHPVIKAGAIVVTKDRFRHVSHPTLGPFFSGKPAILTTFDASKMLTNGTVVTVNGKNGEVYLG